MKQKLDCVCAWQDEESTACRIGCRCWCQGEGDARIGSGIIGKGNGVAGAGGNRERVARSKVTKGVIAAAGVRDRQQASGDARREDQVVDGVNQVRTTQVQCSDI